MWKQMPAHWQQLQAAQRMRKDPTLQALMRHPKLAALLRDPELTPLLKPLSPAALPKG